MGRHDIRDVFRGGGEEGRNADGFSWLHMTFAEADFECLPCAAHGTIPIEVYRGVAIVRVAPCAVKGGNGAGSAQRT